ncbi:MAG: hypothetical protein ACMUJM_04400 [bacterium]
MGTCTTGSAVVGVGGGNVVRMPPPPVIPGIPPPRFKAIKEVNVGAAVGRVTVVVTTGKTGTTVGVNGNGATKVVGTGVAAVRLRIMVTVGVGGGAREGTRDVTVNPAAVTWGTVTVKGVKLDGGNAAALNGSAETGANIGKVKGAGTPNILKSGGKKVFCARD